MTRRRKALLACAVGLAAILLATGIGKNSASASDAITETAKTVLANASAASGDPTAIHGQWVHTSRGAANKLTAGASMGAEDSEDVILIQASGHFTAYNASTPFGGPLPTGTVMTLIIDPVSGQVLDAGLGPSAFDLSTLGAVHDF